MTGPHLITSPTATKVVVTSIAAPRTSPVIPPNRRTQCRTNSAATPTAINTATGPCQTALVRLG